ncbi:MAG: hypothetical protein ABEJ85_03125 [Haloarculaceae archaeon]
MLALAALVGVTAAVALAGKAATEVLGLGWVARGITGRLLFAVSFVVGFALVFAGFVLWYRHRSELFA